MKKTDIFLKNATGFTIIELIVVICVIAVLASIVMLNVFSYINRSRNAAIKNELGAMYENSIVDYDNYGDYKSASLDKFKIAILNSGAVDTGYSMHWVNGSSTDGDRWCACASSTPYPVNFSDTATYYCLDSTSGVIQKYTEHPVTLASPAGTCDRILCDNSQKCYSSRYSDIVNSHMDMANMTSKNTNGCNSAYWTEAQVFPGVEGPGYCNSTGTDEWVACLQYTDGSYFCSCKNNATGMLNYGLAYPQSQDETLEQVTQEWDAPNQEFGLGCNF